MHETAIGAVIHNDTLTVVVRQGKRLLEPEQHRIDAPLDAVAHLLALKALHRHDDPIAYLDASSATAAVLDGIRERDEQSRDAIIDGLSPAFALAGPGVHFYNRRSELHYGFRRQVAEGNLLVPALLNEQIMAFAEKERDGKVYFPPAQDVAEKLGRYPAMAVAAVLASIDAPARSRDAASVPDYNPYAPDRLRE